MWQNELHGDCDEDFILTGIREGFRITDKGSHFQPADHGNTPIPYEWRHHVNVKATEVAGVVPATSLSSAWLALGCPTFNSVFGNF